MSKNTLFHSISLVLLCLCLGGSVVGAQSSPSPSHDVHRIIVKFTDGSAVRLRDGGLRSLSNADINAAVAALRAPVVIGVSRLFRQTEAELDGLRQRSVRDTGQDLADLNLYYQVTLAPDTPDADALRYIDALNAMANVETAYPAPLPAPLPSMAAQAGTRDTTPDYSASQGYRNPAPQGVGIDSAWGLPGGRGGGVIFVDLEYAWNFDHEDYVLDHSDLIAGEEYTFWGNHHGTAVLGVVIGSDNGLGVTGLTPDATTKVAASLIGGYLNIAQIILDITGLLPAGSVLLIEQQAIASFNVSAACTSVACDKFVPVEVYKDVFDAITYATANGIIVVEAGANGSINLDHALFKDKFNRNFRDSGAILVGAADPTTHQPYDWSSSGSRIDVYGWGGEIYTTGYGDLFTNGVDENQNYTANFSGTSGASPMVAGAAIALQGIAKARGDLFTPSQMRALLRSTGTPQAISNRKIGAMPNLAYALVTYLNSDGNLLTNKGFEDGASGWVVVSAQNDGTTCKAGVSAVGACAFRFVGNAGENSRVSQTVNLAASALGAGDTLTLSFALRTVGSITGGKARLVITYSDGTKTSQQALFTASDVYATQMISTPLIKTVRSARVIFAYRGTTGRAFVDDVKLSAP